MSLRGFRKWQFFNFYYIIMHFFKKYVRIRIKDHLVQISILSLKLDEGNASYACKYNSILWDFHVFHCISSIYHIIIHFFEKYIRIKRKDYKILVQTSKLSLKLDEVNVIFFCKLNSILWAFYIFRQFTTQLCTFFKKKVRIKIEDHKILVLLSESLQK